MCDFRLHLSVGRCLWVYQTDNVHCIRHRNTAQAENTMDSEEAVPERISFWMHWEPSTRMKRKKTWNNKREKIQHTFPCDTAIHICLFVYILAISPAHNCILTAVGAVRWAIAWRSWFGCCLNITFFGIWKPFSRRLCDIHLQQFSNSYCHL